MPEKSLTRLSICRPVRSSRSRRPDRRAAHEGADMAQYLVLIYEDEQGWQAGGPAAEAGLKAHMDFGEKYADVVKGGNALQPTSTATTIRDGVVTDGPFIESKEALGGYYLIEADDLDQALAVAKAVPAPFGGVEVRPIMTLE
jgi:hypothetical protein